MEKKEIKKIRKEVARERGQKGKDARGREKGRIVGESSSC